MCVCVCVCVCVWGRGRKKKKKAFALDKNRSTQSATWQTNLVALLWKADRTTHTHTHTHRTQYFRLVLFPICFVWMCRHIYIRAALHNAWPSKHIFPQQLQETTLLFALCGLVLLMHTDTWPPGSVRGPRVIIAGLKDWMAEVVENTLIENDEHNIQSQKVDPQKPLKTTLRVSYSMLQPSRMWLPEWE